MAIAIGAGRSLDPVYDEFTKKLTQVVITSAMRASAVERGAINVRLPDDKNSLERVMTPIFKGKDTRQRLLRNTALISPRVLTKKLSGVDFASNESVAQQATEKNFLAKPALTVEPFRRVQFASHIDSTELAKYLRATLNPNATITPTPATPPEKPVRQVRFMIDRVKCIKQVGWELTDIDFKDKILCGGLGFDSIIAGGAAPGADTPSNEHFRKVPQFTVGLFERNGKTKQYKPDKEFCAWPINGPNNFPRTYCVVLALGEQDTGDDFPKLLANIWDILEPVIQAALKLAVAEIATLVGTGVGAGAGAVTGNPLVVAATAAIGAAVGVAIGAFIEFVIETLRDDILQSASTPMFMYMPTATEAMFDGNRSETYSANFVRPGMPGEYEVRYYWELIR